MTLYLLDPNLTKSGGHHFDWNLAIAQVARKRGEHVVFYAHKDFDAISEPDFKVIPWFSHTCYERRSVAKYTARFDDFRYFNDTLADELSSLPQSSFSALDCILVPTLTELHLLGFISWIKTFNVMTAPLFVVHLMFPSGLSVKPNSEPKIVDPEQTLFYGLAFQRAAEPGPHIHFFAGGRQIAREFVELSGLRIEPHPIPWCPKRQPSSNDLKQPKIILFAGDVKADKGFHLIPSITKRLATEYPSYTFLIHANATGAWNETRKAFEELLDIAELHSNVRLKTGHLSRQEYDEFQREADCALFTYDPLAYARKSSGVLWEAISLGLPVLVPEDTWMFREAQEWGAGVMTFAPYTVEAICTRFRDFVAEIGIITERSRTAALRYHAHNGGDAMLNQLAQLWTARIAAARLVGQPTLRQLALEAQTGKGLYSAENVDGRIARWTAKDFVITFVWGYDAAWELQFAIGRYFYSNQVISAQAFDTQGAELATTGQVEDGVGTLVIYGPGGSEPGEQHVRIVLPSSYKPAGETRDLGILLRDVSIGPRLRSAHKGEQAWIRVLTPIEMAGEGAFLLREAISGTVPLNPWEEATVVLNLKLSNIKKAPRALHIYINGEKLTLFCNAHKPGEWKGTAQISRGLLARGGYMTRWDLINPVIDSEVLITSFEFKQENIVFQMEQRSFPMEEIKVDKIKSRASAFNFSSIVVDDYFPESGEYRHIGYSIYKLSSGERSWAHIKFNLCNYKGFSYLEFRARQDWPIFFRLWPGTKSDGHGAYARFPDPDESGFHPLVDGNDRALLQTLFENLEAILVNSGAVPLTTHDLEVWTQDVAVLTERWRKAQSAGEDAADLADAFAERSE